MKEQSGYDISAMQLLMIWIFHNNYDTPANLVCYWYAYRAKTNLEATTHQLKFKTQYKLIYFKLLFTFFVLFVITELVAVVCSGSIDARGVGVLIGRILLDE